MNFVLLCRPSRDLSIDILSEQVLTSLEGAIRELELTTHIIAVEEIEDDLSFFFWVNLLERVEVVVLAAIEYSNVLTISLVLLALPPVLLRIVNQAEIPTLSLVILKSSEGLVET